jgi:hypothetical protein
VASKKESILNLLVLVAIYAFLLNYFKPSLILRDTHIAGGDTGSFNYMLVYLKEYLLPNGKIIGWSPGWFAGIPMFQFYFPIPFLVAVVLSYAIPLNIAFKLVTLSGTFLLPVACFLFAKFLKLKFPIPAITATLVLLFLFNEGNSMWGGNIPSTLAGEFSYSLSLAFTVLFLGSIFKGIKENKLLLANVLLLTFIALTHVYTLLFAVASSLFFILKKSRSEAIKNLKYLLKVYFLAFLLVSFWFIPALAKSGYRTPLNYVWQIKDIKEVIPTTLLPALVLAFFGALVGFRTKDERVYYILFIILVALLLYKITPILKLTDARCLPFFQLMLCLLAAYAFVPLASKKFKPFLPVIVLLLTVVLVAKSISYIPYWIEWNYSGFESKSGWQQFDAINKYLESLPEGRVVHEFSRVHDKFGTVRAFESIPLFAKKPVLEGLLIESAVNAPFVFWIQSEISETPTCPIPGMTCSQFSLENATPHLQLFNVNYIVATSEKLKNALKNNPQYTFLKSFGEVEVYKVNNTGKYVEIAKYEPVLVKTKDWKKLSLEWFKNRNLLDVPLVFSDDEENFKAVIDDNLTKVVKIPVEANCSLEEFVANEEIRIKTSCIGKPLLIKVSYSPNWKVEGAEKVYLASPAFMLVFPKSENVRIYYTESLSDLVGKALSIVGLVMLIACVASKRVSKFLSSI